MSFEISNGNDVSNCGNSLTEIGQPRVLFEQNFIENDKNRVNETIIGRSQDSVMSEDGE